MIARAETRGGSSVRKYGKEGEARVRFLSTLAQAQALSCSPPFYSYSNPISLVFLSVTVCLFGLNIHVIPPPFLHSSLSIPPLHTLMSPAALQQQHAAVLHGPKDLRVDSRTLWPPQQGQAQVAVLSTGLCGSDCTFSPPPATPPSHSLSLHSTLLPSRP
jgi:hypothetical protein